MMQNLNVTLVQQATVWQDPIANRKKFSALIAEYGPTSDVIVFPEMFTTGYSQESAKLAETMDGPTVMWMKQHAAQVDAVIAGSVVIQDGERTVNRLLWVQPDGDVQHYDKRHLFSFASEQNTFDAGHERKVVDYKGWRICLQVCYDLRFPVWSRNIGNYDVLLYVASWPQSRIDHWQQLLKARAIENLSYVVAVNRIGEDGNGYLHNGQSAVIDPKGRLLLEPGDSAGCFSMTLDYEAMISYRKKFGALQDRDEFTIG